MDPRLSALREASGRPPVLTWDSTFAFYAEGDGVEELFVVPARSAGAAAELALAHAAATWGSEVSVQAVEALALPQGPAPSAPPSPETSRGTRPVHPEISRAPRPELWLVPMPRTASGQH